MEEIIRFFPGADYSFHSFEHFLAIEAELEATQAIFPFLGGSIRSGEILLQSKEMDEIESALVEFVKSHASDGKKTRVGINIFPEQKYHSLFPTLFRVLKNASQEFEISLRIVNRKGQNLDTSTTQKEGLLQEGHHEFSIFACKSALFLTKTFSIQNIESFAKRDFGKPVRDMGVGMLPPKLARMMINLSRDKQGNVPLAVWDTFCGTGSVLLEALDMGIAQIMGSDISKKMLDASQKNISFFCPHLQNHMHTLLFPHDATKSFTNRNIGNFTVVCEGFLGRIFSHSISDAEFFEQKDVLLPFYENFLRSRKEEGIQKIVLAIPFWKGKEKEYSFSQKLLETAKKIGYDAPAPILYRRPQQFVGREILVFQSI